MCVMNHSQVCHDSITSVPLLIHVCAVDVSCREFILVQKNILHSYTISPSFAGNYPVTMLPVGGLFREEGGGGGC